MQIVDKNTLKRRSHLNFYSGFENPLFNISFNLKVRNFLPQCRKTKTSSFCYFLHKISQAIIEIPEFMMRIRGDKVVKHDTLISAFTVIDEQNIFKFSSSEYHPDLAVFEKRCKEAKENSLKKPDLSPDDSKDNCLYVSCVPWLSFNSVQHPVGNYKDFSIPSIAWGKYDEQGDILSIPFSVQAHHGLVDGYHVGLLQDIITRLIRDN